MPFPRIKERFHGFRAFQGPFINNILEDRSGIIDKIREILDRIFLMISFLIIQSIKIFIFYNDDEQREQYYHFLMFSMLSTHCFCHHIRERGDHNRTSLYLGKNWVAGIIILCCWHVWQYLFFNKIWANGADQSDSHCWFMCSGSNGINNALYYDIICMQEL